MRLLAIFGLVFVTLAGVSHGGAEFSEEGTWKDDRRGEQEAHRDLQAGKLMIKTLGYPGPSYLSYAKVLRRRYGIELSHYGCCTTGALDRELDAYNKVMVTEIKRRFGYNVFARASDDADRQASTRFYQPPGRR